MAEVGMCLATLLADPMSAGPDDVRRAAAATAEAGATDVSVWAHQLAMLGPLADFGLRLSVVEAATSRNGGPSEAAREEAEAMVAAAVEGGATKLVAVCLEPSMDHGAAAEGLAMVVDNAWPRGVQVCVEFLPWSAIPDLATAWGLVQSLGGGAGILLDSWHWQRQPGGPVPDLLAAVPGERIGYVQLCDAAPGDGRGMDEAMAGRLLPGDGVVDFAALAAQLAAIGATPVVATEIFNPAFVAARGDVAAARAMLASAATAFVAA